MRLSFVCPPQLIAEAASTDYVPVATYSNLENHPRLIRARHTKSVPKISLDPKTGLPIVDGQKYQPRNGKQISTIEEEEDEDEEDRRKCCSSIRSTSRLTGYL